MPKGHRDQVGIWLWGDPERIEDYLELGIVGIVTNTIVLDQMVDRYGQMAATVERYLRLQESEPVVVEVDGDTTEDLVDAALVFTRLSPRVVLKIPTSSKGLRAVARLKQQGHDSMVTTLFSASQAVAAAAAGAAYVAPFIGPTIASGADTLKIIGDIVSVLRSRSDTPYIAAGIVRNVLAADVAIRAGCDGIVISPEVYEEMLLHPGTAEWNATFRMHWDSMKAKGALSGVVEEVPAFTGSRRS